MNSVGSRWALGALIALGLAGCAGTTWSPPSIVDFPEAPQSLVFNGQLAAQVVTAQPTSCAWGTGPSGPEYAYGAYFKAAGGSFEFTVSTDPKAEPYTGPGTYHAHATLDSAGHLGPGPEYQGGVRFVVTDDPLTGRVPGGAKSPNTGTVDGSLKDLQGRVVSVSGGWTCVPSMLTGPG